MKISMDEFNRFDQRIFPMLDKRFRYGQAFLNIYGTGSDSNLYHTSNNEVAKSVILSCYVEK
jgi:hypothetical protein